MQYKQKTELGYYCEISCRLFMIYPSPNFMVINIKFMIASYYLNNPKSICTTINIMIKSMYYTFK